MLCWVVFHDHSMANVADFDRAKHVLQVRKKQDGAGMKLAIVTRAVKGRSARDFSIVVE